jgi:DNA-binding response OmpR family regulator
MEIAMGSKKKVLMADDSKTALMMATTALRACPYEVTTAADGEEALQKALANPPDIVVLDVMMPKLDGFEVCRKLRESEATRNLPIIMLTTRGESEHRETGRNCGATEYLTKPLVMSEFLGTLKSHLGV